MRPALCIEKSKEQVDYLLRCHYLELVGIFDVHNLIADIVGCLHQIDQRMAAIPIVLNANHTQLVGYAGKHIFLAGEIAEFALGISFTRRKRIFHYRHQHRIGHSESSSAAALKLMHEPSEAVGIALEMGQVVPLLGREKGFEKLPLAFGEKCSDGLLAAVPEWRIAKVVGKACCSHYLAHVEQFVGPCFMGISVAQTGSHLTGQRFAHTRHFKAVRQSVMHKYTAWQRKDLCLILQAAKWRRKYQSVIIALKVAAYAALALVIMLKPEALIAYQLIPLHRFCHSPLLAVKFLLLNHQYHI